MPPVARRNPARIEPKLRFGGHGHTRCGARIERVGLFDTPLASDGPCKPGTSARRQNLNVTPMSRQSRQTGRARASLIGQSPSAGAGYIPENARVSAAGDPAGFADRHRQLAVVKLPAARPSADHHRRAERDLGRAGCTRRGRPRDADRAPSNVDSADRHFGRPEPDPRPLEAESPLTDLSRRAGAGPR